MTARVNVRVNMDRKSTRHNFARQLNRILDARGFPGLYSGRQNRLAELLQVTPQAVKKWLDGDAMPTSDKLVALARLFGLTVDDLLNRDTPMDPTNRQVWNEDEQELLELYRNSTPAGQRLALELLRQVQSVTPPRIDAPDPPHPR